MATAVEGGAVPQVAPDAAPGLSSPPDSHNASALDSSDSELSDLDDPEEDIGEVVPDYYADDGRVPVFKPTMHQFKDFKLYLNKINSYGMKSGIVKVVPPSEWRAELPPLDEAVKTIKIKDPIKQEIMGTAGTYRQANILHQRSYNLPQWRELCEQSDHQPPAKRGERRTNSERVGRGSTKNRTSIGSGSTRKKAAASSIKKQPTKEDGENTENDRLPTPVSPSNRDEHETGIKQDNDEDASPAKSKGSTQPKAATSVSSRRKYNRREAARQVDEAAFKDFKYQLEGEEFTDERCEELERAYWKTLTYAPPLYGADMVGSLFDESTKQWNLGNLENLLDVLGTKIPGVNTAYLYLGMWKATFAWHLEDVDLYSINYLHFGAPKQWYSISQGDARRFEAAMKSIWPQDAKACDQFLRHKTFLISPSTLLQNYNIKVNKVVHHPGEFVITFPYGYHSGYNLGYNCAEAVNFALDTWLDFGRIAKKCDCDQAQDSVWIDVGEIERKLAGIETEDEMTDIEEEDEDGPVDLPTPPESSGDSKSKTAVRKRKRQGGDHGKGATKKIRVRIRVPSREPCALCPNDIPSYALLSTDDGRKVHRICASYIPETDIESSAAGELVTNTKGIDKQRLGLRCGYCHSKKGACFQCSFGKCVRAFHATCAAAAGVLVEEGERPVFSEDGTEYKENGFEFSCRFHRTKRDKKLERDILQDDARLRKAASRLAVGDTCQMQHYGKDAKDIFAGIVVENRHSEEMLLIDVLPKGDRVEVEYMCLRLPEAADFRLPKPSANAIPMPTSRKIKESLNTSKRQADDLPRKDDEFVPGFTVSEFNRHEVLRNPFQVEVDLSKDNQIWHYLGKTSTEARAQYTEDPAKRRENHKGRFLDTIPKAPSTSKASRSSMPASYPINQHALNAARATGRAFLPNKSEKAYEYKPRVSGSGDMYRVDPQAHRAQQSFLQQSTAPYSYGTDPRSQPATDNRSVNPYTGYPAVQTSYSQAQRTPPSSTLGLSLPSGPYNAVGTRPPGGNGIINAQSRPMNNSRTSLKAPSPFMKYPYLQKEHNRSPLDYKSPYSQTGGFMNGYEGDLKEYLRRNPEALFSRSRGSTLSLSRRASPVHPSHFSATTPKTEPSSLLPTPASLVRTFATPSSNSHNVPHHQITPSHLHVPSNLWQTGPSQLHPAIKKNYSSLFHKGYQFQEPKSDGTSAILTNPMPTQAAQCSPHFSYQSQVHAPPPESADGSAVTSHQPQSLQGTSELSHAPSQSAYVSPLPQTASSQITTQPLLPQGFSSVQTPPAVNDHKPVYAHQRYFQNAQLQFQQQPHTQHRDVPDVPADSSSLIEQMMANLRKASAKSRALLD